MNDLIKKMYYRAETQFCDFLLARDKAIASPTEYNLNYYEFMSHELEGMYSMLSLTIECDLLEDSKKWNEEYYTMKTKVQKDGLELYEKFKPLEKYYG